MLGPVSWAVHIHIQGWICILPAIHPESPALCMVHSVRNVPSYKINSLRGPGTRPTGYLNKRA